MKIFLGIFHNKESDTPFNKEELKSLSDSNKSLVASRKQFKNFLSVFNEDENILFSIIVVFIKKVIEKYRKKLKIEDKEKNILLIEPIVNEIFNEEIIGLFEKRNKLLELYF